MEEYLAFVDFLGNTSNGDYIYRFDFTYDKETVWGEFFNVAPSAIIPNIEPDINSLSSSFKVNFPIELVIAKKNYCFSMQDCIDGIIPLCFSEIDSDFKNEDIPFFLDFGETYDNTVNKLAMFHVEIYEKEEISNGDESAIDALIDGFDDNDNSDDDNL